MAAVSLFWDTNMAAVTSCENTLYRDDTIHDGRHLEFLIYDVIRGKTSAAIFEF